MNLAEFLLREIAADEEVARAAHYEGQHWLTEEEGVYRWPDDELVHMADRKADARHIVRWDPARILAECAAKRAIVEKALQAFDQRDRYANDTILMARVYEGRAALADYGLRLLAQPYRDRDGYRTEWDIA